MATKVILIVRLIINIILIVNWNICEAGLRVLGGRDALVDEFPYVVRLERRKPRRSTDEIYIHPGFFQFCTGAALTPSWILTSAHCDADEIPKAYRQKIINTEIFARYNSYFPSEFGELSPITKIIAHPGFTLSHNIGSDLRIKSDIALYKAKNISVSRYGKVSAVDYASLVGHEAFVLGFGSTNATPMAKPLQVLKGMLKKCDPREGKLYGMLCVVPRCGVKATVCSGDSGGPVVHASGIVGVNTFAYGRCDQFKYFIRPGHPSAGITMVSSAVDWIANIIDNKSDGRS